MKRILLPFFGMAVVLALAAAASAGPPNVVLILVDDLGWTDLGCQGSAFYETPHIDGLAAEGMRFTSGYASCAVCSPTRAAVMTGRYPARTGITDWIRARFQGTRVPEDKRNPTEYVGGPKRRLLCPPNPYWMELEEITIAELLQPAGYTTCHIGKWHLGPDDWYPPKQGFDVNIGGCDFGHPPSYFDPYHNKNQGSIPTLPPRREGEYLTDREADEAVAFIEANAEGPFFLYYAPYAVHTPIQAKEELTERYRAKKKADGPGKQRNAQYAAMVDSVDQAVGRILSTLDELEIADETLVIFTSDNGGLLGPTHNAPLRSGKGYPYEGGVRVPFIVRWPGAVKPGSESDEPVSSIDLLPTICAAVGIEPPADRAIDGRDLLPLLGRNESLDREVLFWHFPHYRGRDVPPYGIVRAGDWKLIKRYEGPTFELFNLADDLGEKRDLAAEMPEKVAALDDLLEDWLADTGAKLPMEKPGYTIPLVDLADQTERQVIVDREEGQYLGHPTTVLLEDNATMITVYPKGHGRGAIVMKRSDDAGVTWTDRLPVPQNWATSKEVPTLYRVIDRQGVKRLIMFSGLYPIRMAVSEDDGATWSPLEPIGEYGGIVAMGCLARLANGDYVTMFHDDGRFFTKYGKRTKTFTLYQVFSTDGGLTWGEPEAIWTGSDVHLCEAGIIRSPDGKQLAILLRENSRTRNSHVMFSNDEAKTWTRPRELPAALTGDRHTAKYAPDGRLFISFRDTTRDSPTQGDWVGWVGTYGDIVAGREGQYRVRLMDNKHRWDCAYPGVEVLPDGTFVSTTYGHWSEGEEPYIVSVRFTLDELDAMAAAQESQEAGDE